MVSPTQLEERLRLTAGGANQRTLEPADQLAAAAGKKVLVIAFDFPPRRTSGVYRPTAMTKHLWPCGWQATVLTIQGANGGAEDNALLAKVPPGVKVVRTPYFRLNGWEWTAAATVQSLGIGGFQPTELERPRFGPLLRTAARIVRAGLYFPDETAGWVPVGLSKALELVMAERFDAVYTTHPPRAAHTIGLLLKMLCGIPWVAEFRDPWILAPGERSIPELEIPAPRRNQWLHGIMLRQADAVITVTPGHAEEFRSTHRVPANKVFLIRNGFDEDDFQAELAKRDSRLFAPGYLHFSHFGTIYPQFSGQFFPALSELLCELPLLKDRIRVHIIGYPDDDVRRYAKSPELQGTVQVHPVIAHQEALQAMRSSHCLLLFYGHRYTARVSIPGKLYEYLRVGRPVLAVTYDGGVKDLIQQGDAGWVIAPEDREGIKNLLRSLVAAGANGVPPRIARPEYVAQFRYDRLAEKLAEILNKVTNHADVR